MRSNKSILNPPRDQDLRDITASACLLIDDVGLHGTRNKTACNVLDALAQLGPGR